MGKYETIFGHADQGMLVTEFLSQFSFTYMIIQQICTVNFRYNLTTYEGNNFYVKRTFEDRSLSSQADSILVHVNRATPHTVTLPLDHERVQGIFRYTLTFST